MKLGNQFQVQFFKIYFLVPVPILKNSDPVLTNQNGQSLPTKVATHPTLANTIWSLNNLEIVIFFKPSI
jgi:hypothetical protein